MLAGTKRPELALESWTREHRCSTATRRDATASPPPCGAFLPCSFWLVQALAHTGRRFEADALFCELLGLASTLGLYAEEMEPTSRRHLGNYPQALTHSALIQAVLALQAAEERELADSQAASGHHGGG